MAQRIVASRREVGEHVKESRELFRRPSLAAEGDDVNILYRRCAGLDVHKKSFSACIRNRVHGHKVDVKTAEFGTTTQELECLRDWLKEHRVKHVAMESTGVYWIPVWNVLELVRYRLELMVVSPQQVRALQGRKTDRIDAQRIAEFLQYGLLRGSFVPPRAIRELRDLTRCRVHLQQGRNRVINRIGRLLETANVKLGSVISNIVGASGLAILQALARGIADPEKLACYKVAKLKCTHEELVRALDGHFNDHFRWLLRDLLDRLAYLDRKLAALQARTNEYMQPYMPVLRRLCTIPGVDYLTACGMVAEIGVDMSVFPTANHLASWAGLCPGNNESAGKRLSGRTRKGSRYLRRLLIQNAWGVAHRKDCGLTAVFYKIASRRGMNKAAMAVAHKILVIAYYIIRDGVEYKDPGGDYLDRRDPERTAKRLLARLERIGFPVHPNLKTILGTRRYRSKLPRPPIPLAQASGCTRCASWGLPCIHARNQKRAPESSASDSEHSG